jgi:twitching motility protein PilI
MAAPATARISLRDYQLALSERLQSAGAGARLPSRLGLQVGGAAWLVELQDAGEVIPVPPISLVPLARPWFKGVANVRGNLYSVTDFAAFLGGASARVTGEARLLLLNERFRSGAALLVGRSLGLRALDGLTLQRSGAALLVGRSLGLRALDGLTLQPASDRVPWVRAQYSDGDGRIWKELDVAALLQSAAFLEASS